jgi:hypothetical protein
VIWGANTKVSTSSDVWCLPNVDGGERAGTALFAVSVRSTAGVGRSSAVCSEPLRHVKQVCYDSETAVTLRNQRTKSVHIMLMDNPFQIGIW